MPHRETPAIIIDCHDFMETDKIITFFTLSFGKLTGIAKGAKKSKKRFGINLDLFSHVNLLFYEKGLNPSLVRIESCDIIHYFDQISTDTKKFVYGCYFLELIKEMIRERQKEESLYQLLLYFLHVANNREPQPEYARLFEIRLLSLLGFKPMITVCVECKQIIKENSFFSYKKGGAICQGCSKGLNSLPSLSLATSKTLDKAQELPLDKAHRISFSSVSIKESTMIIPNFIEYLLGKKIKSYQFIKENRFKI